MTDPITISVGTGAENPTVPVEVPATHVGPDDVAEVDGSLAARLRARSEKLRERTQRIPVPPDDVWNGDLVLVIKPAKVKDRMSKAALIADATDHLEFRTETGQFETIPDGWVGVGRLMGVDDGAVTVGQIITQVCSSQEVVGALGNDVLEFIFGRAVAAEQELGE